MLNKLFLISVVLLLTFCASPLFNELNAAGETHRNVKKGLEYCYNFEWEKAEEVFKSMIEHYPELPEGYTYLSSVYLWYYLSNKNKDDYNSFVKYSDQALDLSLQLLNNNSKNDRLLYTVGINYTYRAIAFAKAGNFLDAVWASKKSESYLTETIEINPNNNDAYLGLGLYNFAFGQIPAGFRWALSLAGITGDKVKGLEFIKLAADEGVITKVEAQYYLSQILSEYLADYDTASDYIKKLAQRYPNNLLFNYSLGVLKIKMRKLNESEKILHRIIISNEPKFKQIAAFSNFLIGEIYFKRNQFDSAVVYYQKFLDLTNDEEYTGITALRLGISYEILGDREQAEHYFNLTKNGNMDIEDDIFAKRKGEIYSKRTLSENEKEVIKAGNLIDQGIYEEALYTLSVFLNEIKTEKLKAEVYLLMSEAYYSLGKTAESINFALKAKYMKAADEKWIVPFASYYLARAFYKLGNETEAKKFLDEASKYADYDYQGRIKNFLYGLSYSRK
jgi:tetratricopeptide (TPR) repeat protein